MGNGLQTDGDHRFDARDLYASEVTGSRCLGLVVGVGETGGGVGVAAPDIECDVPVGADASEEESDASQVSDFLVVLRAPVVNHEDGALAQLLGGRLGLTVAQAQVDDSVRKYVPEVHAVSQRYLVAVDEQTFGRVQTEVLDVIFLYVVVEAVVLLRVDGVELVNLDEMQSAQVGFARYGKSAFGARCGSFLRVPFGQYLLDPRYKIFRSLAGWQADDSVRMLRRPFQEAESGQLAEFGEILYGDVGNIGLESVSC